MICSSFDSANLNAPDLLKQLSSGATHRNHHPAQLAFIHDAHPASSRLSPRSESDAYYLVAYLCKNLIHGLGAVFGGSGCLSVRLFAYSAIRQFGYLAVRLTSRRPSEHLGGLQRLVRRIDRSVGRYQKLSDTLSDALCPSISIQMLPTEIMISPIVP